MKTLPYILMSGWVGAFSVVELVISGTCLLQPSNTAFLLLPALLAHGLLSFAYYPAMIGRNWIRVLLAFSLAVPAFHISWQMFIVGAQYLRLWDLLLVFVLRFGPWIPVLGLLMSVLYRRGSGAGPSPVSSVDGGLPLQPIPSPCPAATDSHRSASLHV